VFILWSVLLRLSNYYRANTANSAVMDTLREQTGLARFLRGATPGRTNQALQQDPFNPNPNPSSNTGTGTGAGQGQPNNSLYNQDAQYRYTFGAPAPGGYGNSFDKARNGEKGQGASPPHGEKGAPSAAGASTAYPS
jgi:hypothetical protein